MFYKNAPKELTVESKTSAITVEINKCLKLD